MSIEQIKKAAKNLQRLLPAFIEKHQPPYALTALQQLVCQMNGYANMELATAAQSRQSDDGTDALGRFYRYPWMEIDPGAILRCVTPRPKTRINLTVLPVGSAAKWIDSQEASDPMKGSSALIIIVAAGEEGQALVDTRLEQLDRSPRGKSLMDFGSVRFSTVSQRVGITLNWLSGWDLASVKAVLKEMVKSSCSAKQHEACCKVVDVIVDQVDNDLPEAEPDDETSSFLRGSARITVEALSEKLEALIAVSEGGWSEHTSEDFAAEFNDDRDGQASKLIMDYSETDLRQLVGPLESLLARVAALGGNDRFSSSMGYREGADNMDFGTFYGGAVVVTVDMETKRLDHVVAMALLSKIGATLEDTFGAIDGGDGPPAEVLLVTR